MLPFLYWKTLWIISLRRFFNWWNKGLIIKGFYGTNFREIFSFKVIQLNSLLESIMVIQLHESTVSPYFWRPSLTADIMFVNLMNESLEHADEPVLNRCLYTECNEAYIFNTNKVRPVQYNFFWTTKNVWFLVKRYIFVYRIIWV